MYFVKQCKGLVFFFTELYRKLLNLSSIKTGKFLAVLSSDVKDFLLQNFKRRVAEFLAVLSSDIKDLFLSVTEF